MEKEKYEVFKKIIRECNYDNTYKMAWAKALVELANGDYEGDDSAYISLELIAEKYMKYYWNQTIYFDLIQGSNLSKPPAVVTHIKQLIEKYYDKTGAKKPIRYERFEVLMINYNLKEEWLKTRGRVVNDIKQDVSWRFLNVAGSDIKVYEYQKGDPAIKIKKDFLAVLNQNEQDLYDLINYRWGMILETFNNSPRISKKVKIIDENDIKRNSLSKFKKYLDLENEEHTCFICGKSICDDEVSIDHVIPWGYLYSDDIWNLVYVHKSCNSKKGIIIPSEDMVNRLKKRNARLLLYMEKCSMYDKKYDELKIANDHDYVEKFWVGCKG